MKTSYTTVVAAFFAVFTLMFNPVSAFAGTTTTTVTTDNKASAPAEKPATTSSKEVVIVNPAQTVEKPKEPEKKFTFLGWLCERHLGKSCECKPPAPPPPAVVSTPAPKPITKPQPSPPVTPVKKPDPVPSAAEIAAAPKADYAVTQTAFESAIVMPTKLSEQGAARDREQDARLDKLERRVDEVPCLIQEAVSDVVVRLEAVETKVVRLEQDVGVVGVRLANVETQVVHLEKEVGAVGVRLEAVETKVVRLEKDCASVKLVTTAASASASAASASTVSNAPQPAPTIIVVPMPAMNALPTTVSGSTSSTVSSCTQPRTTSAVRLAPTPPRSRPSPQMVAPVSASASYAVGCRPGIFTRLGNWLFGSDNCGVVAPPVIQVPQMSRLACAPQQNICAQPPGCFVGRQQCMPSGFGWQQPCLPPVQVAFRPRPQQNCFGFGGGNWGGGGSNVVVTSNNNNNNNNNNNMLALLGRR